MRGPHYADKAAYYAEGRAMRQADPLGTRHRDDAQHGEEYPHGQANIAIGDFASAGRYSWDGEHSVDADAQSMAHFGGSERFTQEDIP